MYKPPGQDRWGSRIKTMVATKIITSTTIMCYTARFFPVHQTAKSKCLRARIAEVANVESRFPFPTRGGAGSQEFYSFPVCFKFLSRLLLPLAPLLRYSILLQPATQHHALSKTSDHRNRATAGSSTGRGSFAMSTLTYGWIHRHRHWICHWPCNDTAGKLARFKLHSAHFLRICDRFN
jgi:hypothetical protein